MDHHLVDSYGHGHGLLKTFPWEELVKISTFVSLTYELFKLKTTHKYFSVHPLKGRGKCLIHCIHRFNKDNNIYDWLFCVSVESLYYFAWFVIFPNLVKTTWLRSLYNFLPALQMSHGFRCPYSSQCNDA